MNHASLFTGIGGFDLAAEWMGWNNVFQVEIDPFCNKVLEKNFPSVKRYGDIKQFDGKPYRGAVDILTGGFPCQPYSLAGQRKGKEDDRHLWPEMLRVIGEVQPSWIVGENVPGLLNWEGGMVLHEIKVDLEGKGFEVFPSLILPACGKNAPHRRDRLWIVAYSESNFRGNEIRDERPLTQEVSEERYNESLVITNTNSKRMEGRSPSGNFGEIRKEPKQLPRRHNQLNNWDKFPTQSPVCGGDDGIPNRVDRIKSIGNAVVPQVVYEIFKAIETLTP